MVSKELAKEWGFTMYNNDMNNMTLRGHHREYDESIKKRSEERRLKKIANNGEHHPILIREDGMVNATLLYKAGNKEFMNETADRCRDTSSVYKSVVMVSCEWMQASKELDGVNVPIAAEWQPGASDPYSS